MHEAVAAIAACGVSPIVRIAANEGWMVKSESPPCTSQASLTPRLGALDSGAHGIIVPLVNTAGEAQKIVHAAKFPPFGGRGFGSPFSVEKFGIQSAGEYLQQSNDALVTIVQIETSEALQNVDLIAKVSGIDVIFIGPFDLGNSIGHPITDGTMAVELKDAIATILQTAKDNGKHTGIYATSGEQAREFADQGFQMVCRISRSKKRSNGIPPDIGCSRHDCDSELHVCIVG